MTYLQYVEGNTKLLLYVNNTTCYNTSLEIWYHIGRIMILMKKKL